MKEEKFWFVVRRHIGAEDVNAVYVSPKAILKEELLKFLSSSMNEYDYEYIEVSPSIWQGLKFLQDNREMSLNRHLEYLNYVCAELKDMNNGIEETINEMREEFQSLLEKEKSYEK